MSNNGRRREPLSTILAGQRLTAQVASARGTVYGSDDQSLTWAVRVRPAPDARSGGNRGSTSLGAGLSAAACRSRPRYPCL